MNFREVQGSSHIFFPKYYMIIEVYGIVPLMCADVLLEKIGGQYGSFNTKNEHISDF